MRDGEKRIWLMGSELTLRPIAGRDHLEAIKEAERLEEKYGGDEETKRILKAACLTVKGVYEGDVPKFSSAEEVLETLSAHEILFAAEEYEVRSERPTEHKNDPASLLPQRGSDVPHYAETERKPAESDKTYAEYRRDPFTGKISTKIDEHSEDTVYNSNFTAALSERQTLERLSELAERISRRYDGGFERY